MNIDRLESARKSLKQIEESTLTVFQKADMSAKAIAILRLDFNSDWNMIENFASRIARLAEQSWLANRLEIDLTEYTIQFITENVCLLLDPEYNEDYIISGDKNETFDYTEYRVAI